MSQPQKLGRFRRVIPWALSVAVVLVAYVYTRDHTLDATVVLGFVQALAWPVVVGGTLFWLRQPLKLKVEQLLKVGFGGALAEFDQSHAQTVAAGIELLGTDESAVDTAGVALEEGVSTSAAEQPGKTEAAEADSPEEQEARRKHLRDQLQDRPPAPAPRAPAPVLSEADLAERVRRLEAEIRKLELDSSNPFFKLNTFSSMSTVALLAKLKARLRRLDPNSPYAS